MAPHRNLDGSSGAGVKRARPFSLATRCLATGSSITYPAHSMPVSTTVVTSAGRRLGTIGVASRHTLSTSESAMPVHRAGDRFGASCVTYSHSTPAIVVKTQTAVLARFHSATVIGACGSDAASATV